MLRFDGKLQPPTSAHFCPIDARAKGRLSLHATRDYAVGERKTKTADLGTLLPHRRKGKSLYESWYLHLNSKNKIMLKKETTTLVAVFLIAIFAYLILKAE